MTRYGYLAELEQELAALPQAERDDALAYYAGYFADAGDDARVMESLGAPAELARAIIEKTVCVPQAVRAHKDGGTDNAGAGRQGDAQRFGPFDAAKIRALTIRTGAADISIVPDGSCFVDYSGTGGVRCSLGEDGALCIETARQQAVKSSHLFSGRIESHGTIALHLPSGIRLDRLTLALTAGEFRTAEGGLCAAHAGIEVGAGTVKISGFSGGSVDIDCGMGDVRLSGSVTGESTIKCGMGNVRLALTGAPGAYSVHGSVGMGTISFNGQKRGGFARRITTPRQPNHFSVSCSMGSVRITVGAAGGNAH